MFLQLTGRLPALKRKGSVTPTKEKKPKKQKRVRIKERRRSKSLEPIPSLAVAVSSKENNSKNDPISDKLDLATHRERMATRMGLRSRNRSDDGEPQTTEETTPIRENASNAVDEENRAHTSREGQSERGSVNHLTDGSDIESPGGIPNESSRVRLMPQRNSLDEEMAVPSNPSTFRQEMEVMRRELERSVETARMEIDLVSRENREELRDGLRTIQTHLNSLNELSTEERTSSALALKELKRELR